MKEEKNYDFLRRMREIHKPDRRNHDLKPCEGETVIDSAWTIAVRKDAPEMIRKAACDLQDYLFVSMGVSVRIETPPVMAEKPKSILLTLKDGNIEINCAFETQLRILRESMAA